MLVSVVKQTSFRFLWPALLPARSVNSGTKASRKGMGGGGEIMLQNLKISREDLRTPERSKPRTADGRDMWRGCPGRVMTTRPIHPRTEPECPAAPPQTLLRDFIINATLQAVWHSSSLVTSPGHSGGPSDPHPRRRV